MNNQADSFQLDEHLARLLAAYDDAIDGADEKAPTINVPSPEQLRGEKGVSSLGGNAAHEGSLDELLPEPAKPLPIRAPKSGKFTVAGGPHRIGRFELRRQLGKGGCGIVFLAYDPKLEREVALKIPRPEMLLSPDARRRLVREALAAAEFDHPNLVPVYETGEIGPICFIATAFCPGQTLGEWLDKQSFPVPVRQAARLVATISEAVHHAHDRGVLHRDLKPNNVILQATKDDPVEQETPPGSVQLRGETVIPRVVDFGLAKLVERGGPSETTTRQILGTPKYMAPEQAQARHEDIGPAADIYALGVILYEMLTGRAPYEGASDVEVLRLAIDGNMTRPRHLRKDIPRDLEAICLKAMHRIPGHRYRTAIDLADDLRRFLDDKPTIARPLKWSGRAARWLRRNDQAVALGVVTTIATVLLAVGSWSMMQTRQLKNDRDTALRTQAARTRTDQQRDYARAVQSAFLAWRAGDRKAAAEYLEMAGRLAQTSNEPTDFAHGYLSRLVAADRLMIVCPAGAVTALAVSADGKRLASGHADGTLAIWDRATGEQLGSVKAYDEKLTHIVFALGDSRLYTIGGRARTADSGLSWTVSAKGEITPTAEPNRTLGKDATCLCVSDDGNKLYFGTRTGELVELPIGDPKKERVLRTIASDSISTVQFDLGNSRIHAGTNSGRAFRISFPPTSKDWEEKYEAPVTVVSENFVAFRGGIYSRSPAHTLVPTWRSVDWLLPTESGVAMNTGPGWVTMGGLLATGDLGEVRAGAVTREGRTLFTAGDDGVIRSWEIAEDRTARSVLGVPNVPNVLALAVHPEGRGYALGGQNTLHTNFGSHVGSPAPTPLAGFTTLRVLPDSRIIGVELRDRLAILGEPNEMVVTEKARFALPDKATAISADLAPEVTVLAVGDDRGRVFVWNVADKKLLASIDTGQRQPIRRVALSSDGKTVAAPTAEGLGIWTVGSPQPTLVVPSEDQIVFKFFPGGERLVTAGRAGVVRVWSIPSGREELTLHGHVGRVTGLGVSPDGRTLVSGGATGEVKFWDSRTGLELLGLRRHSGPITAIEFAANGKMLVTAGTQVGVWETAKE